MGCGNHEQPKQEDKLLLCCEFESREIKWVIRSMSILNSSKEIIYSTFLTQLNKLCISSTIVLLLKRWHWILDYSNVLKTMLYILDLVKLFKWSILRCMRSLDFNINRLLWFMCYYL